MPAGSPLKTGVVRQLDEVQGTDFGMSKKGSLSFMCSPAVLDQAVSLRQYPDARFLVRQEIST